MDHKNVEEKITEWLGVDEVALKKVRSDRKREARKKEIAKLEEKLISQASALAATVKRLKSAKRSLLALKRAKRKAGKKK